MGGSSGNDSIVPPEDPFECDKDVMTWAKEVNAVLIEFEGQLSFSDIESLTRKELYYLRKERQAYHKKMKEQADKAADEAKKHAQQAKENKSKQVSHHQKSVPKQNAQRTVKKKPVSGKRRHR